MYKPARLKILAPSKGFTFKCLGVSVCDSLLASDDSCTGVLLKEIEFFSFSQQLYALSYVILATLLIS